jgi:hypothetical protein
MAGLSSNLGLAPQGGFSLWATSNEEMERGLGEWSWMNVQCTVQYEYDYETEKKLQIGRKTNNVEYQVEDRQLTRSF